MTRPDTSDYATLFTDAVPLLDVRAPVEFARGAFPNASNLPLLTDDERQRIGLRYRQSGQRAAIALGHELVGGDVRDQRTQAWLAWCRQHPNGLLYCFRGGLRSQIVQDWLRAAGCLVPRIAGGYKAMRRFLIESIEPSLAEIDIQVLTGRTGSGKTRVIAALDHALDLEHRAHHRGSAFGRRPGGQPPQIAFENAIAIDLLRLARLGGGTRPVVVEDEGSLIGRCHIPPALQAQMAAAPVVRIDEPLEARVALTLDDYVVAPQVEYSRHLDPAAAFEALADELLAALDRIRRRLGEQRHAGVRRLMSAALDAQRASGNTAAHRDWIRVLLRDYYDPMYDYLLARRNPRVLFSGTRDEVLEHLGGIVPDQTPAAANMG